VADLAEGAQIQIAEDLKAAVVAATDFCIGEGREGTLMGISGTHRVQRGMELAY
jgi:hypothetical protein